MIISRVLKGRSKLAAVCKKWLPEVEESWFSADNDYDRESLALLRKRLASGYTPEPIKVEVNQVWEKSVTRNMKSAWNNCDKRQI